MEAVNIDELQWWCPGKMHRDPGIEFKTMFRGEHGKPDNYWFTLAQVNERYYAPRHRHNFDQVRFVLKGEFGFNEDQRQQPGTVGYFTEGTYYTQIGEGFSHTLVMQCENASRTPYLDTDRFPAATAEMRQSGSFINGKYHTRENGQEIVKDGFEAVWEHMTGQKLDYVEPRYDKPIIMDPSRYVARAVPGEPGVSRKLLGVFTERELAVSIIMLEAGATHHYDGAREGLNLGYVLRGEGRTGDIAWRQGSGLRLTKDDIVDLTATSPCEIFMIGMPK